MKTTFELSTDLEEAVTDYVNKVLQPNEPYTLGQLGIFITLDDDGATATATVLETADDEAG